MPNSFWRRTLLHVVSKLLSQYEYHGQHYGFTNILFQLCTPLLLTMSFGCRKNGNPNRFFVHLRFIVVNAEIWTSCFFPPYVSLPTQDAMDEGVSKSFRTEWITKSTTTIINTRWETTQRVMAAKLTRLTHRIAIQLLLVAERCTICSSRSRRPVRKLLNTPSFISMVCNHCRSRSCGLRRRVAMRLRRQQTQRYCYPTTPLHGVTTQKTATWISDPVCTSQYNNFFILSLQVDSDWKLHVYYCNKANINRTRKSSLRTSPFLR
jgi:hypothetical protein